MHTHDRTLISQMGFADPDKGDRRHDLACRFLAASDTAQALYDHLVSPRLTPLVGPVEEERFRGQQTFRNTSFTGARFEYVIAKGSGQYRSMIGFLDLVRTFQCDRVRVGKSRHDSYNPWEPCDFTTEMSMDVVFEVKISRVGTGDLMRQINLYREFYQSVREREFYQSVQGRDGTGREVVAKIKEIHDQDLGPVWCAATAFPLEAWEAAALEGQKIRHITLGRKFQEWCESHAGAEGETGRSISL